MANKWRRIKPAGGYPYYLWEPIQGWKVCIEKTVFSTYSWSIWSGEFGKRVKHDHSYSLLRNAKMDAETAWRALRSRNETA